VAGAACAAACREQGDRGGQRGGRAKHAGTPRGWGNERHGASFPDGNGWARRPRATALDLSPLDLHGGYMGTMCSNAHEIILRQESDLFL
jgi:hypothetical protein